MKVNKAYRFRLYPNKAQRETFAKTFGCTRFIYNQILYDIKEHYEKTGERLYPTPAQYKGDYPWLKEVDSLALANAQQNLKKAFTDFFKGATGYPRFKAKKREQSYTTNNQKGTVALCGTHIKLPIIGRVRVKQHREIPEEYTIKSATIRRTASGKYYVSVLFAYESQVQQVEPKTFIGLDFSVPKLFVSSETEIQTNDEFLKNYRKSLAKLAREQRILSHRHKGSHRYEKQRIKVARLHEHIMNKRNDYLHKVSTEIANQYDAVCIEDIQMREITDMLNTLKKGMGKYVLDNGFYNFTVMLDYKLTDRGKYLVKVNKTFLSTQICSDCGYINNDITLADRTWTCPNCGETHDRDINAAINIEREGRRLLSA